MTTALASLLSGRPVKHTVGMTGEVTLQGRVLPIGGLKQKVLAAHAAGLTDVIIPERNRADLDDVPADVKAEMTFHPVMTLDEVLELALEPAAQRMRCRSCTPVPEEVRRAADLLERRWTVSILWASHEGAVALQRVLAVARLDPAARRSPTRLVELEQAGVLERTIVEARPPRVEYRLTERGRELRGLRRRPSRGLAARCRQFCTYLHVFA